MGQLLKIRDYPGDSGTVGAYGYHTAKRAILMYPLRVYSAILIPLGCTSTVNLIRIGINRCREGIIKIFNAASYIAVCTHTTDHTTDSVYTSTGSTCMLIDTTQDIIYLPCARASQLKAREQILLFEVKRASMS